MPTNFYDEIAGRRMLTIFEKWCRQSGEKIGRSTLRRSQLQNARTPRQRRANQLASQFLQSLHATGTPAKEPIPA